MSYAKQELRPQTAPLLFWSTAIPMGSVPIETGWSNIAPNNELGIHRVLNIQVHFLSWGK